MKDSEFIELLNLYLDHEISAADAARLESEVQSNASRRRVYQDYCRMQKACKLLADDFATTEPAADDKIVSFNQARVGQGAGSRSRYVTGGLIAAAACLTFIVVGRYRQSTPNVQTAPTIAQTAPATTVAQTNGTTDAIAAVPVKMTAPATATTPAAAEFAFHSDHQPTMLGATHNDPHFAWIQDVRLAPIQMPVPANQLKLETNLRSEDQTYSSTNKPLPSDVQWTAIRFQR